MSNVKTVRVPTKSKHRGQRINTTTVALEWECPVCGEPRGEVHGGHSYDGSLPVVVSTWENPCGHIDKYSDVLQEAAENGLNS